MSGHTPGPWSVVEFDRRRSGAICDLGYGIQIAHTPVLDDIPSEEESAANARLIAAAPELYEACKRAKKLLEPELVKEPDRTIFWQLVAAIAKAEGK